MGGKWQWETIGNGRQMAMGDKWQWEKNGRETKCCGRQIVLGDKLRGEKRITAKL